MSGSPDKLLWRGVMALESPPLYSYFPLVRQPAMNYSNAIVKGSDFRDRRRDYCITTKLNWNIVATSGLHCLWGSKAFPQVLLYVAKHLWVHTLYKTIAILSILRYSDVICASRSRQWTACSSKHSNNLNFGITCSLYEESTGHMWIRLTKGQRFRFMTSSYAVFE